jgi:hypothetical protein
MRGKIIAHETDSGIRDGDDSFNNWLYAIQPESPEFIAEHDDRQSHLLRDARGRGQNPNLDAGAAPILARRQESVSR